MFTEPELKTLPLAPDTLVHGWVRVVHQALTLLGKPVPEPLDYPAELQQYLPGSVRQTTLGEVHRSWLGENPEPVFIKPVRQKVFTGHTIARFSHLGETKELPPDTAVWVSSVVNHTSEYRCFVFDHCLVGMKHYAGDPWSVPDRDVVLQMIRDYSSRAPVAYGLDVGIVSGRTRLVEVNDMYSLGNYSFNSHLYCEMLEARWLEMVNGRKDLTDKQ